MRFFPSRGPVGRSTSGSSETAEYASGTDHMDPWLYFSILVSLVRLFVSLQFSEIISAARSMDLNSDQ